jgi:hypothetical protein
MRLHAIQKKVVTASSATIRQPKKELAMIHDYCLAQVSAGFVTGGLIDMFVAL